MPSARKFAPSLHPRDRFGRFTRSRSAEATTADRKSAVAVAGALKPKRGITGAKAGDYLRSIGGDKHQAAVSAYTAGGHEATHKALRAGRSGEPSVKAMDAAMIELPDDLILSRRVPNAAFGPEGPESLVGLKVRDAAYAPTGVGTVRATKGDVRMRLAVPAGTRAAVDPGTGEVILDRDLEMVVAKVEKNSLGGHDMFVTVLPKLSTKPGNARDGDEKSNSAAPKSNDEPDSGSDVRADLMTLKVPELQARMRERGLKPGRMRKSQMVDALVADEVGDSGGPDDQPSLPETSIAPAVGADALAAAPSGLGRESNTLSAAQVEALGDYQSAYFQAINGQLRRGELSGSVAQSVAAIDSAMDRSALTADVEVWRGRRNATVLFGDRADGDLTGTRWREDAYVSTSADERQARNFASDGEPPRPLLMRITAPEGTNAVELSPLADQAELLIARGHEFEVVADRGMTGNLRHLDVRVGEKAPPAPAPTPVEPSALWATARTGELAFNATTMIQQAAGRLRLDRKIRQRDLQRVQQSAVSYGQGPDDGALNYVTINAAIRGHGGDFGPGTPDDLRQAVTDLDLLITGAPLVADMRTWRGIRSPTAAIPGWSEDGDNTGLEWTAEGFQSTTTDELVARRFATGVESDGPRTKTPMVARVLLPKGTPGLAMSPVVSEILLERNRRFRLVADRGMVDGVRQVDIELIAEAVSD